MLKDFSTEPLTPIQAAKIIAAANFQPGWSFVSALHDAMLYLAWLDTLPTLPCDIGRSGDIERS